MLATTGGTKAILLGLLVLASLLTGCASDDAKSSSTPPGMVTAVPQTASPSPSGTALTPAIALLEGEIVLTNCQGIGASQLIPMALSAATGPAGWTERLDPMQIHLIAYECERFSLDRFERGPLHFLLELQDAFQAPEACTKGDFSEMRILHAIWVDDAEVAAHMADAYDLPALYVDFSMTREVQGELVTTSIEFGPPGIPASFLQESHIDPGSRGGSNIVRRLAWPNGEGGVSLMDLDDRWMIDAPATNLLVTGKLRPPVLYTSIGIEDFATPFGNARFDGEASGRVIGFGDTLCKEPL